MSSLFFGGSEESWCLPEVSFDSLSCWHSPITITSVISCKFTFYVFFWAQEWWLKSCFSFLSQISCNIIDLLLKTFLYVFFVWGILIIIIVEHFPLKSLWIWFWSSNEWLFLMFNCLASINYWPWNSDVSRFETWVFTILQTRLMELLCTSLIQFLFMSVSLVPSLICTQEYFVLILVSKFCTSQIIRTIQALTLVTIEEFYAHFLYF